MSTPAPRNACPPVHLVGAGPGDPGLITVRGRQVLAQAEVVIADRLVAPALLEGLAPEVEVLVRGARRSTLSQEEINRLLVERALAGKRVVRLKGGDPFVFGRGGEEAECLRRAGIPFEVVPGVTAAIAAPAYAGIPITHRGLAGAVAFVTGHEADDDAQASAVDWTALARGATTLVLYMSVGRLGTIAPRLIAAGRDAGTPVALIERGTTSRQRTLVSTLGEVVAAAREAGIEPPALTIVGEVVALRDKLAWFEARPLHGRRVLALRASGGAEAEAQAEDDELRAAVERLEAAGAELVWASPLRVISQPEALAEPIARLASFRWLLFTSPHAVAAFAAALDHAGLDARALAHLRVACLGGGRTEATLRARLALRPDVVAVGGGRELAAALFAVPGFAASIRDGAVLFPRAGEGRPELPEALRAAGVPHQLVAAYRTDVDPVELARLADEHARRPFHAIAFGSPRGATAFLDACPALDHVLLGAVGETTARALTDHGFSPLVATHPSYAALLDQLGAALARRAAG